MAVYVRYAHKAEKHVLGLDMARDRKGVAFDVVAVTVLDKGTGTFTLTFQFFDGTELTLDSTEVANGDRYAWDIEKLMLTNTAQPGETVKLLTEIQVEQPA